MRYLRWIIAIIFVLSIALFGLLYLESTQKQKSFNALKIELAKPNEPILSGEFNEYVVNVFNKNGEPTNVDNIYFHMNMEMMNHPMEGNMKKVKKGTYSITVPVAMKGEWYIELTLKKDRFEKTINKYTIEAVGDYQEDLINGYLVD